MKIRKIKWRVAGLLLLLLGMAFAFGGCKKAEDEVLTLRIANCEEYIDEGDWDEEETIELSDGSKILGENSMVDDFEDWYKETYGKEIRVEYSTYGTNEDLYNQLTLGSRFDLVCPSEYMILKLMGEEKLVPFSKEFSDANIPENFYARGVSDYIRNVFAGLTQNGEPIGRYAAGYMWGTMGIVYNPEAVAKEDLKHWNVLLNPTYKKQITMKDSVRDSYFVSLCILNEDVMTSPDFLEDPAYEKNLSALLNATDQKTVDQAERVLSDMRQNAYSMETDSGKADMVSGKVLCNMQWSGDAVYTMDQAEEDEVELCFFVPEEGSNLWFDGWVMLKDGIGGDPERQQAAEAFVNFISAPENVVRNMYYIGYTSCISGGDDGMVFDYLRYNYEVEDPAEEEAVDYPLDYFFGTKDTPEGSFVLHVDPSLLNRQLSAQYPTQETIRRCAVMACYDQEANARIMRMWTNIRCFEFPWS